MWRHIAQSAAGGRHASEGAACQDYCAAAVFGAGETAALVACAADGAGSCAHSGIGSRLACEAVLQAAATCFDIRGNLDALEASDVLGWLDAARNAVALYAQPLDHPLREYATTLCVAIVSRQRSVFVQIGDGAMVVRRHGPLGVVFWPQSGEYINTTNFLTAADYREVAQVCTVDHGFSDVAILTDGLERLALRFDGLTAHGPFFDPLFHAVRSAQDLAVLNDDLRKFLESPSIRTKTDDDATLVLASLTADAVGTTD